LQETMIQKANFISDGINERISKVEIKGHKAPF